MAAGPDVHQAHGEDTERYVLTNLNMVRPRRAAGAVGSADRGRARGPGGQRRSLETTAGPSMGACGHSVPHPGLCTMSVGWLIWWVELGVSLRLGSHLRLRVLGWGEV